MRVVSGCDRYKRESIQGAGTGKLGEPRSPRCIVGGKGLRRAHRLCCHRFRQVASVENPFMQAEHVG